MSTYPVRPEYETLSEKDVVARCQNGDLEAFNFLISRYETKVLNLSLRYLRDYHQALDETQEIFLKVFRKIALFKGESAFGTWLYRITANHCMNVIKIRRRNALGRERAVSLDTARDNHPVKTLPDLKTAGPDDACVRTEMQKTVVEMLETLPDIQRQIIILRHFELLSYKEIADILELRETTVRSCMHRARQRLKAMIQKQRGRRS